MTFRLIQSATVVNSGVTSIQITGIPSTFTDLLLIGSVRDSTGAVVNNMNIVFNQNTSTIYSARRLYGNGSSATSDAFSNLDSAPGIWNVSANATSNTFNNFQYYIPNYASSSNKSISMDSVTENNATAANQGISAGLFASTSAINRIDLSAGGSTFSIGSAVSLYGITRA